MTVRFDNSSQATRWALEWLRDSAGDEGLNGCIEILARAGFSIRRPDSLADYCSLEALRERHAPHLSPPGFHARLRDALCPPFTARRGPSGRILEILPTPDLVEFLARPSRPGRRRRICA